MQLKKDYYYLDENALNDFIDRFALSCLDDGDSFHSDDTIGKINCIKEAFNYMLSSKELTEEVLKTTANKVNKYAWWILNGYRNLSVHLYNAEVTNTSQPGKVEKEVAEVIEKYNSDWQDMDLFQRETNLFLRLIAIRPFEDGNCRTAMVVLNSNLIKNGYPPIIMPKEMEELRDNLLNNKDMMGLENLFKQLSDQLKKEDETNEKHKGR